MNYFWPVGINDCVGAPVGTNSGGKVAAVPVYADPPVAGLFGLNSCTLVRLKPVVGVNDGAYG